MAKQVIVTDERGVEIGNLFVWACNGNATDAGTRKAAAQLFGVPPAQVTVCDAPTE